MKLTMLGTGNAAVTECYNTCFVLSEGNRHFLVDAGGGNGVLKRLKQSGIRLEDIHDVFVTHEHVDHLLGVVWIIRMVGQRINQGTYEGELRIYCHEELADKIMTIAGLTIQQKVCRHMGEQIRFIGVETGSTYKILDCETVFFDIHSTKARQFGFVMQYEDGKKLACLGDEPYNEVVYEFVRGSDWMMHEAFCLYSEAEYFKPYEKHHSTVKEASVLAEVLGIPNLVLYHTEDKNIGSRKQLYTAEGLEYYSGNLYVPDDLDVVEL